MYIPSIRPDDRLNGSPRTAPKRGIQCHRSCRLPCMFQRPANARELGHRSLLSQPPGEPRTPLRVIAAPTATGKTRLALPGGPGCAQPGTCATLPPTPPTLPPTSPREPQRSGHPPLLAPPHRPPDSLPGGPGCAQPGTRATCRPYLRARLSSRQTESPIRSCTSDPKNLS